MTVALLCLAAYILVDVVMLFILARLERRGGRGWVAHWLPTSVMLCCFGLWPLALMGLPAFLLGALYDIFRGKHG